MGVGCGAYREHRSPGWVVEVENPALIVLPVGPAAAAAVIYKGWRRHACCNHCHQFLQQQVSLPAALRFRSLRHSIFLASWPGCTSTNRIDECRVCTKLHRKRLVNNPSWSQQGAVLASIGVSEVGLHWGV